jgi:hypothetical protein
LLLEDAGASRLGQQPAVVDRATAGEHLLDERD